MKALVKKWLKAKRKCLLIRDHDIWFLKVKMLTKIYMNIYFINIMYKGVSTGNNTSNYEYKWKDLYIICITNLN